MREEHGKLLGAFGAFVLAFVFASALSCRGEELSGVDTWAGIKPRPAIVNPIGREASPDLVSLRGEWEFVTQPKAFPRRYRHTPFIVGEGRKDCYLYLGAVRCGGKARQIASFGLDLLSGTPEGTSILDGILDELRR